MVLKARVFSSSRNGKGTLLCRGEGGFAAADPRPLISGFLVRFCEGGLLSGELFHCCEGGLLNGELLRCGERGLLSGELVTLCDAAFSSFLLLLCFSVF